MDTGAAPRAAPVLSVLAAVAAALCYAVGNVYQHATVRAEATSAGRGGRLRRIVRSPRWIAGLAIAGVGTGLHIEALHLGRLFIVQPVVVCGMLVALPLSALLGRRRQRLHEWFWAAIVSVGLAVFLLAARPHTAVVVRHSHALLIDSAAACAVIVGTLTLAALIRGRYRPVLLGLAAGIAQGIEAALQKQVVSSGVAHPLDLIGWALAALAVLSVTAAVLTQVAYAAGDLAASLPALSIANPLVAAALGVAAFGERLSTGPTDRVLQVGSAVLMAAGVLRLAAVTAARVPTSRGEVA